MAARDPDTFERGNPSTFRRRPLWWSVAAAACVGMAWLFWLAVRVTVESKTYARIGDIPGLANCTALDDVGPVRTRSYRHPHGDLTIWVTGEWPDDGFQSFVSANELFTEKGGDCANGWAEALPAEFTGGTEFKPQDSIVIGVIRGCEIGLKGVHSTQTGKFIFLLSLRRCEVRLRVADEGRAVLQLSHLVNFPFSDSEIDGKNRASPVIVRNRELKRVFHVVHFNPGQSQLRCGRQPK